MLFIENLESRFNVITQKKYETVYLEDKQKIYFCFHPSENKKLILLEVIKILQEYDVNIFVDIHEQSGINLEFY